MKPKQAMNFFDTFHHVMVEGICTEIQHNVTAQNWRAAVILTYSAIDTCAWLSAPETDDKVTRQDFIQWCDNYLLIDGITIPGIDLYAGRCGMVHTYGTESDLSKTGKARQIFYTINQKTNFETADPSKAIIISITGLVQAYIQGVADYFTHIKDDVKISETVLSRLNNMIHIMNMAG